MKNGCGCLLVLAMVVAVFVLILPAFTGFDETVPVQTPPKQQNGELLQLTLDVVGLEYCHVVAVDGDRATVQATKPITRGQWKTVENSWTSIVGADGVVDRQE